MFPILQGNAETLIRWRDKFYHVSVAYFLWNISTKIIKIPQRQL